MWQLTYLWAKTIHRLLMWLVLLIGSGMMVGGLLLHREVEGEWIPTGVDMIFVRQIHNLMAVPFALTLGLMMLTGLLMWGVPKIMKNRTQ